MAVCACACVALCVRSSTLFCNGAFGAVLVKQDLTLEHMCQIQAAMVQPLRAYGEDGVMKPGYWDGGF